MAFDTENDIEMVKRLKYTKELLATLQKKTDRRKRLAKDKEF